MGLRSGSLVEAANLWLAAVWAWSDDGTLKDDSYYMQMCALHPFPLRFPRKLTNPGNTLPKKPP